MMCLDVHDYMYVQGQRSGGIQVQKTGGRIVWETPTVEGCLLRTISRLMKQEVVRSMVSSRTDAGVHALRNTITVDLPDRQHGRGHDLELLQKLLNKHLQGNGHEIRIHKIQQVDDNFMVFKKPFRRSYVYRLGIVKERDFTDLPVHELQYAHMVKPPFDMDRFQKAAEIMCGTHNFLAFTLEKTLTDDRLNFTKSPIKNVSINIRRGAPFIGDIENKKLQDSVEFWEVHVTSKSYMYKQIRRMVNGLLSVASGKNSFDDLKHALDDPKNNKIPNLTNSLPPNGLFLKDVEYHSEDLIYKGPLADLKAEYRTLSQTLEQHLSRNSRSLDSAMWNDSLSGYSVPSKNSENKCGPLLASRSGSQIKGDFNEHNESGFSESDSINGVDNKRDSRGINEHKKSDKLKVEHN